MAGLNRELNRRLAASHHALMAGGLVLQAGAQKRAPHDLGNLKNSAYTRRLYGSVFRPVVAVGFSAAYALPVHEYVDQKMKGVRQWRKDHYHVIWSNGEPKFLEKAAIQDRSQILAAIAKVARAY